GGVIHMKIAHTLAVDGYIKANSENIVKSDGNGGSGGSITIYTHNFTGSHTGHIQVIGGSGDVTKGGGGAGGRIALYHSRNETIPHYRGYFDSFGGKPGTNAEAGAAGTVYVHDGERSYSMLQIDNNGQRSINEETAILNEGHRIDLSSVPGQYSTSTSYTTTHGHIVTSNQEIYVRTYLNSYRNEYYRLHHMFDHTMGSSWTDFFMARAGSAKVTITLNQQMYINKIKIYPTIGYSTKFKVTGYNKLAGSSFEVTSNYILPSNHGTQGSYIDLPVGQEAVKFDFDLVSTSSSYVALCEIEIFSDPSPDELRYKHIGLFGASTWIFADRNEQFTFSEVILKGQSHLAFMPRHDYTDGVLVDVGNVIGDKTGFLHVGYNQEVSINKTAYDVPFNTHVYETGHVTYPPRTFFYKTKLVSSGKVSGMEDLYVFKGGLVSIDTSGSIATSHTSAKVSMKSLHVQEAGTFEMKSYTSLDSFNMDATNISIYGGGHFKVNTALKMTVHHLLAVYSGGKLDLSGAGFLSDSVNHGPAPGIGSASGGSGGGHGGSGGRGSGLTTVGIGYDSMYEPNIAGSAGGHGYHFGELYFGDNVYGNTVVRKGLGGPGGGKLEVRSRHVDIDGLVAANGMNPDARSDRGAGGGAGGAIWIICEEVVGHGTITAFGGNGGGVKGQAGGGGAGGRISVQCDNIHKFNITMRAYGGVSNSETGGAGTSYLEARHENGTLYKKKLTVDNNGHAYPHAADYNAGFLRNLLNGEYKDITNTGGVTWLYHDKLAYSFKELDVRGNAHVAILSDTDNEVIDLRVDFLWGDRTGVLHAGKNQTFGLRDVDVYLPTNLAAYRYSRIEVPSKVTLREVWAEINGTIEGMNVIAVENEGELYIWSYANSDGYKEGQLVATNISVRAGGKFEPLTAVEQMNLIVTRLVVNGNGYVRTNSLKLNATNVTIDLSGDFHADYTGFPGNEGHGKGRNANTHEGGGTGAGHGGRGGRCKNGYFSAYSYDSMYFPTQMGSGGGNSPSGNGGRGGGIIHMFIKDELRVEGRLHSNGEKGGDSKAGGGAGGSLYISANHLDGTGSIEVTGGAGGTNGGGGGGGRIAIYHTDQNHFTGKYLVHGGWGTEQYGGPGTVYLESRFVTPAYRHLTVDNNGHSTSNRIYEVERLNLAGNYYTTRNYPEMVFHSHNGVNTTTTARPHSVLHSIPDANYYYPTYPLSHLFTPGKANVNTIYMSHAKQATLTIDLPYKTYVEYLQIFPYCESFNIYGTAYAVGSSLEGGTVTSHTNGFVNTDYCQTQREPDQFGTVEIRDNIDKIIIHLRASGSYVALSEVEVYVQEDPTSITQTPYNNGNGAGFILPETSTTKFTFDKLEILGGASLNLDNANMKLTAHQVYGDDTGRVTLRRSQTYNNTQDRVLQTFGILTQRESSLNLPLELDCRGIDMYVKGYFHSMENFTVNARCNLTIDHHKVTENSIDNLDIKTFGSVRVFTEEEALTTLVGTSLTVRSGARLTSNDLKLDYYNVTIEPYGLMTVTEGCPYNLQHEGNYMSV
ncbi:uncharacterized protein LOC132717977, partial [Ruditapes philippinarum]|uniref:uncharacterized protein LOC132717977 n=1 Tax=Ruditapes philippinarum TaxID=129788 RepID=UPI00295C09FB